MIRPNRNDYITPNQTQYNWWIDKYYTALEKYCDYLESVLKTQKDAK